MTLRAALSSAPDLFAKLRRDADALGELVTSDRLFNFIVTAHSLCDWVKNDPSVSSKAKADLARHRRDVRLKVCRDVANSLKHFELNAEAKARSVTASVVSTSGYGQGRYGVGGYGVGEESIRVALTNGSRFNVLAFCSEVASLWEVFFRKHGV